MELSIVITAYNIEKYIGKCIESVLNQTYKNIEIIIINDGSTDLTDEIINLYLDDKRIKYKVIKNSGVSEARNEGLRLCTKDFVLFIDGDDFLERKCIENTIKELIKTECDILVFDISTKDEELNEICKNAISLDESIITNIDYIKFIFLKKINSGVTNKIFNRSIIESNGICFNKDIYVGEDLLFNLVMAVNSRKIKVLNECYYNYVRRVNSATTKVTERHFTIIEVLEKVTYYLKLNNIYSLVKSELEIFKYFMIFEDRILNYDNYNFNYYFYKYYKNSIRDDLKKNIYYKDVSYKSKIFTILFNGNYKIAFNLLIILKKIKRLNRLN